MASRLRIAALLGSGALGLHQLRYLIAHGDGAGEALAREGHAYLSAIAPVIAIVVGVATLEFLLALAVRRDADNRRYRWVAVGGALLTIYIGQEMLEGVLAAGHASGVEAAFANGGWVAIPLAACLGLLITLLLRGADRALTARARCPRSEPARPLAGPFARAVDLALLSPLACHLAGRAPPHLLIR